MSGRKKKDVEAVKEAVIANRSGTVNDMADCVVNNPTLIRQLEALGFRSSNPNGMTFKEAMICSQIANAVKGDMKSYRAVMEFYDNKTKMPLEKYIEGNSLKMPSDSII